MNPPGAAGLLVSVVITTHNRLPRLKESVRSVQCQEEVGWELIVIDDASSDGTAEWLASDVGPTIRSYRFACGVERSRARNQGLSMANGEMVMFLDDDDVLWPHALKKLYESLMKNPSAIAAVGSRWEIFEKQSYERRDAHPRWRLCRSILPELLFGWSAVSGQNLYRTSLVRQVGGYDPGLILCEDRDLWLRLAPYGDVVVIPDTVVSYLYHENQFRPSYLPRIRARVALKAVHALPSQQQTRGKKLIMSGRCIENAEKALSSGRILEAFHLVLVSLTLAPKLYRSPLIGEWIIRRLVGRAYRRVFPVKTDRPI